MSNIDMHAMHDLSREDAQSAADRLAADLAANGSYVTADDLAAYQIREPEPVIGTYRGYTVFTSPPPHGGPTPATT